MKWEYMKKRRNVTLETFLEGVSTYSEALLRFSKKGIEDPPIRELKIRFMEQYDSTKSPWPTLLDLTPFMSGANAGNKTVDETLNKAVKNTVKKEKQVKKTQNESNNPASESTDI